MYDLNQLITYTHYGKEITKKASELSSGSSQQIKVICDSCGKELFVSIRTINKRKDKFNIKDDSYNCQSCASKALRVKETKEREPQIIEYFIDRGCKVTEIDYYGFNTKITYIAQCGHSNIKSFGKFQSGYGDLCNKCTKKQQSESFAYNYEDVLKIFIDSNCILLSDKFTNIYTNLNYICECGNKSQTTLKNFLMGKRCGCKIKSGTNHPNYNPNKTDKERIEKRATWENVLWRRKVYEKDNYTCGCCGERGGILNAHHIQNFADNHKLRLEILNGITLCKTCHQKFHSKFGNHNTTAEQLIEYNKEYHVSLRGA